VVMMSCRLRLIRGESDSRLLSVLIWWCMVIMGCSRMFYECIGLSANFLWFSRVVSVVWV